MHYPDDHTVLEASDITHAFIDGTTPLPGGHTGIRLVVAINPLVGKVYSDKDLPTSLFVTNGVNPRRIPLLPMPDMSIGPLGEKDATKQHQDALQAESDATGNEVVPSQTNENTAPIIREKQPTDEKDAAIAAAGLNPLPESAAAKTGAKTQAPTAPTPEHPADVFTDKNLK